MPLINISDIDVETSVQVRAEINSDTVKEYAEHITEKRPPLPPIIVFGPDSRNKYYLSEGWHRLAAHKQAGRTAIQANIREGGWKDALEHALGSNAQHGLRRTNADKRRAVKLALDQWAEWSDQVIANKCAVSREFVFRFRKERSGCDRSQPGDRRSVIGQDGKTYPLPPVPSRPSSSESVDKERSGCDRSQPGDSRPVIGQDGKTYPLPPVPSRQPSTESVADDGLRGESGSSHMPFDPPHRTSQASAPEPPPLPIDQLGQTVPPHLVPLWERRHEVKSFIDHLSRIHKLLEQARDDRDPLFFGAGQGQTPVNFSAALTHLQQARSAIKEAMPFAVCPMCQSAGCRCCSGNGLISKFRYDTIVPAEKKVNL